MEANKPNGNVNVISITNKTGVLGIILIYLKIYNKKIKLNLFNFNFISILILFVI